MTRQRIYIAPEHAGNAALRAAIETAHPGAEIFPRRVRRPKAAPAPKGATELTPEGEQFVIPGCEKNRTQRKGSQLDLWS